jgi:hypothetical protein
VVNGNIVTRFGMLYQEKSGNPDIDIYEASVGTSRKNLFFETPKFCEKNSIVTDNNFRGSFFVAFEIVKTKLSKNCFSHDNFFFNGILEPLNPGYVRGCPFAIFYD